MLPIDELMHGTMRDAVEYLARRAAHVRVEGVSFAEKKANQSSDVLSSLGGGVQNNHILGKALLGGALGAGVGAGSHVLDQDEQGKRRKGILNRMLTGAVAGTALGGGAGLASHYWPGTGTNSLKGDGAGGGGGGGGGPDVAIGGKNFKLDPKMLRDDPSLIHKVHDLTTSPWYEQLPGKAVNFLFNNPVAPTTTPLMVPAALGDMALHSNQLRLGERMGWGMIDPRNSRNPDHLRAGMNHALKENMPLVAHTRETLENMLANREVRTGHGHLSGSEALENLARNEKSTLDATANVNKTEKVPGKEVVTHSGGGQPDRTVTKDVVNEVSKNVPVKQTIDPTIHGELRRLGAQQEAAGHATNPMYKDTRPNTEPQVFRGLRGDRTLRGNALLGPRGLSRLGFYGGVPAAEYFIRSLSSDVGKSQELHKLLAQARQKGYLKPSE